jgi:hypothetical protein
MQFTVSIGGDFPSQTYRKTATANDAGNLHFGPIEVPHGATNQQLSIGGIDISQLKGVFIASDQDVLIEFNDSSGAGGSIALDANAPYLWMIGDLHSLLITADVTAVFVTNASGATATIRFDFLQDVTP